MSDTDDEPMKLPPAIKAKVTALVEQADAQLEKGEFAKARDTFGEAFMSFPEPKLFYEMAADILTARGDALLLNKEFEDARKTYANVVRDCGGLGNPYLHLRLGQSLFELGKQKQAADELTRAYMGGGAKLFADEDPNTWRS